MASKRNKAGYIVHASDLASFDREDNFREACRYAKAIAPDHGGCSVYAAVAGSNDHGDCLAAYDGSGRKLYVG